MTDDADNPSRPAASPRPGAKSLSDADIATGAPCGRRSFLSRLGAGLAGVAALSTAACQTVATGITDADTGPYADAPGYGRGGARQPQPVGRAPTGITDADSGTYADPAGYGRGGAQPVARPYTGITDADSGPYADPAGYGRGRQGVVQPTAGYTGVTDADSGPYADRAGFGRGGAQPQAPGYTGLTDSDRGPYSDPAGYGRRGY